MKKIIEKTSLLSFIFFLAFLPLGIRKIFDFQEIQTLPGFREDVTVSLFLFDIPLLVGLAGELALWFFFKKKASPKTKKKSTEKSFWKDEKNWLFFFAGLTAWSIFNYYSFVSLYLFFRIITAIGIYFWLWSLCQSVPPRFFYLAFWIILLGGAFQSILALGQFYLQKSWGLFWLGESRLGQEVLGVAKLELEQQKFIRGYGTFPHPNLLGAFLLFSLAAGIWLLRNQRREKSQLIGLFFAITLILIGLTLSFSRSAWLATALWGLLFYMPILFQKNKKFSSLKKAFLTFATRKKFHLAILALIFCGFLFFLAPFILSRIFSSFQNDPSFSLRKEYASAAKELIGQKPLTGFGLGQFCFQLTQSNPMWLRQPWTIQPVHNLYLLAVVETGIGALLFFGGVLRLSTERFLLTKEIFPALFLSFLFLGLFDHYFWTLPQGRLLFFLALAFSALSCKIKEPNQPV